MDLLWVQARAVLDKFVVFGEYLMHFLKTYLFFIDHKLSEFGVCFSEKSCK